MSCSQELGLNPNMPPLLNQTNWGSKKSWLPGSADSGRFQQDDHPGKSWLRFHPKAQGQGHTFLTPECATAMGKRQTGLGDPGCCAQGHRLSLDKGSQDWHRAVGAQAILCAPDPLQPLLQAPPFTKGLPWMLQPSSLKQYQPHLPQALLSARPCTWHALTHTCTHTYTHMHLHTYLHTHTHSLTYTFTHIHTHTHSYIHTYTPSHIHMPTLIHLYTLTCANTH